MAVQENDHGGPEFVTFEEIEGVYETQILPAIEKHIKKGSKIISDGEGSYVKSKEQGYDHDRYIESQDPEMAHEKRVYADSCGLILAFLGNGGRNAATIFSLR